MCSVSTDFVAVAARFPNVLFPFANVKNANAAAAGSTAGHSQDQRTKQTQGSVVPKLSLRIG